MMRRVLSMLFSFSVVTMMLVGLKWQGLVAPGTSAADAPLDPSANPDGVPADGGVAGTPGVPAPSGAAGTPGVRPSTSAKPGKSATTAPKGSTAPKPTTTTKTTAPPAKRTITGSAFAAKDFGSMQVSITVTGTHIDSVSTIQQSNRPKSTASILGPKAVSAQGVPSGTCKSLVSGATYSCDAWKQSLQSALGKI